MSGWDQRHDIESLTADEHEHHYATDGAPRGAVVFCSVGSCTDKVVIDHRTGKPRELTAAERTAVTIRMWEDTIYVQALSLIHGREGAIAKVRQMRGYS